jgi:TatD DNase family protein
MTPPVLVDSHCHLDDERFAPDLPSVLDRAYAAGIGYMQTICTERKDFPFIHKLARENPRVFCSYGAHPHHSAAENFGYAEIIEHGNLSKVIGIGETGLDYYYNNSPCREQIDSFRTHIKAARQLDLPVIIHTRDADDDTMAILDEARRDGPFKALFHCFSSSRRLAEYAVEHGIYVSASGILTFKKSDDLRAAFALVPPHLLMVETDAPYLAPTPHRGERCEPAHTRLTAQALADVKGMPFNELAEQTTHNFFTLFSKATR